MTSNANQKQLFSATLFGRIPVFPVILRNRVLNCQNRGLNHPEQVHYAPEQVLRADLWITPPASPDAATPGKLSCEFDETDAVSPFELGFSDPVLLHVMIRAKTDHPYV